MKPRRWEDRWERVGQASEKGGQGETFEVQDRGSGASGMMKLLLSNNKVERRGRFRREAVSLETLRHPRIPRLLDSNSEQFEDLAVKLYMVQERIPGRNLEKFVIARGPLSVEEAVSLSTALLDTLCYCHAEAIGHRDIKPDNIVLRDDDPLNPVLVDFGQSFPCDEAGSIDTEPSQIVGNRFLPLPEHGSGGSKRDLRSDLTQLAGVLFYAVTGLLPGYLQDGERRPPHARPAAVAALDKLDAGGLLKWFFDRALAYAVADRFQDGDAYAAALGAILPVSAVPLSVLVGPATHRLGSAVGLNARRNLPAFADALAELAKRAAKDVHAAIGGYTHTLPVENGGITDGRRIDFGLAVMDQPSVRTKLRLTIQQADASFWVRVASLSDEAATIASFECSVFAPTIPPNFAGLVTRALALQFDRDTSATR